MKRLFFIIMMLAGCNMNHKTTTADIYAVSLQGTEQKIGTVQFADTTQGLSVKTNLSGLPAGTHGFHIHENPSCDAAADTNGIMQPAQAAGGHYDPNKTGKHLGPDGHGHKGDLPALDVAADGTAKTQFYIKDLKVDDIQNRSIIIHAGGDNYKDEPLPLGGGGARIACGIIK